MGAVLSAFDERGRADCIRREQNKIVLHLPEYVEELNALTEGMKDKDQFRLKFKVVYGETHPTGYFTVLPPPPTVCCDKVHVPTESVSESWSFDLKEFHHIFLLIQMQKHLMSSSGNILSTVDSVRSAGSLRSIDDHTCHICMERREEVVLKCMHTYCQECLDKWLERNSTCPMCREEIKHDDPWQIADAPKRLNESTAGDALTAAASALGVHRQQPSTHV